jgi:hypothetical protein
VSKRTNFSDKSAAHSGGSSSCMLLPSMLTMLPMLWYELSCTASSCSTNARCTMATALFDVCAACKSIAALLVVDGADLAGVASSTSVVGSVMAGGDDDDMCGWTFTTVWLSFRPPIARVCCQFMHHELRFPLESTLYTKSWAWLSRFQVLFHWTYYSVLAQRKREATQTCNTSMSANVIPTRNTSSPVK